MIPPLQQFHFEKYWASNRCLLSCSYWGFYYTRLLHDQFGKGFTTALIISKKGHSTCYFDIDDRRSFGEFRVNQIRPNWPESVSVLVEEIKKRADELVSLTEALAQKEIGETEWQSFVQAFTSYIGFHISPRNIIDFLPQGEQEQIKEVFTEVRLYTEPVWEKTEHFVAVFAQQIASKMGYDVTAILACLKEEIEQYFKDGILPPEKVLTERYRECALIWMNSTRHVIVGDEVLLVENSINQIDMQTSFVKGSCAYGGKVSGRVRIVLNPKEVKDFTSGDILVTGMTRPEFLMLMKSAAAIVTDAGGILCHAAITAREIKKPTVIGTVNATKFFRDGDIVEVDADAGTVRKL